MDGIVNWMDINMVILTVVSALLIPLIIAATVRLIRNPSTKALREEYERRIEDLKAENKDLRNLLRRKEELYRKELEDVLRKSKMIMGLNAAISRGVVKAICPVHKSDVQILVDGTIICREGHRIWPSESKAVEVEEYEYEDLREELE